MDERTLSDALLLLGHLLHASGHPSASAILAIADGLAILSQMLRWVRQRPVGTSPPPPCLALGRWQRRPGGQLRRHGRQSPHSPECPTGQ